MAVMRHLLPRTALLFSVLSLTACGSATSDEATSADDITDVRHTPVKEQTIGNCWLYASVAWAESLHQSATNETADLSESYLTYWHWYEQLARLSPSALEPKIQTGGFFHVATDLMNHYGVMNEASFVPGEEATAASQRQRRALQRVDDALKPAVEGGDAGSFRGRLATAERRTPSNIRAVLSDAYELGPEVRADLDAAFGSDAPTFIAKDRPLPGRIIAPWSFRVTSKAPGQDARTSTLDVVTTEWEEDYVWGDEASSRGALRRMQKTLHDALPAIIVWNVDFASDQGGLFQKRRTSKLDKWDGAHMTVVEDYQAIQVPGFGTLPVGVTVSDPAALNAALADQTRLGLLRIKNSWGFRSNPTGDEGFKGYYDLYSDYLFGMRALTSVIVPRAYDASGPAGFDDVCAAGGHSRTGTYCAKAITNDPNDKRLLICNAGVSTTVRDCEAGCSGQPQGVPDVCAPANPCNSDHVRGPGQYCGASLGIASGQPGFDVLYSCQKDAATGQWISPATTCSSGCSVQPPGVPDACAP
jgi:hypothetical protein